MSIEEEQLAELLSEPKVKRAMRIRCEKTGEHDWEYRATALFEPYTRCRWCGEERRSHPQVALDRDALREQVAEAAWTRIAYDIPGGPVTTEVWRSTPKTESRVVLAYRLADTILDLIEGAGQ